MRAIHIGVFLLFSFAGARAQIGFGPEAGIGISTMRFAPSTHPILYTTASENAVFSYRIGGLVDLPLNPYIYFQASVYFSARGADRSFSFYQSDSFHDAVNETVRLYYAELPLSVVYKTATQGYGRFMTGLGVVPSYLLGGNFTIHRVAVYAGVDRGGDDKEKVIPDKTFHAFDMGVLITAGYELPGGSFIRAYFLSGATNISYGTEITKNRALGISVGRIFGKGRSVKRKKSDEIDITP